jgi:DNA-binding XRE family transcriptional regulator
MIAQNISIEGKPYVMIPRMEYDRLTTLAKAIDLPPYPAADSKGRVPAIEYTRVSIARKIIQARAAAGLTQRELAAKAGIRVETLCRIETGKFSPSVGSIEKIDRVLRQQKPAAKPKTKKKRK